MSQEKRFCPNCGSLDVEPETENVAYIDMGNFDDWRCNDCDYAGKMPEGENPDEISLENSSQNYSRFNTHYARKELKILLYTGIPLIIMYLTYISIIQT